MTRYSDLASYRAEEPPRPPRFTGPGANLCATAPDPDEDDQWEPWHVVGYLRERDGTLVDVAVRVGRLGGRWWYQLAIGPCRAVDTPGSLSWRPAPSRGLVAAVAVYQAQRRIRERGGWLFGEGGW